MENMEHREWRLEIKGKTLVLFHTDALDVGNQVTVKFKGNWGWKVCILPMRVCSQPSMSFMHPFFSLKFFFASSQTWVRLQGGSLPLIRTLKENALGSEGGIF